LKQPTIPSLEKYLSDNLITMKKTAKKKYVKPSVTKVKIDNEISMVMMSFGPGGDPESSFKKLNPLRWWK
jgi:hypothetical protein